MVNWDDGSASTGLVQGQHGSFTVTGNHRFIGSDTFYPTITVSDAAANSITLTSTLYMGQAASNNPAAPTLLPEDPPIYSSGSVSGSNPFSVAASHNYAEEGSYSVSATVNDSDGASFVINTTAIVADNSLSVVSTNPPSGVSSGNAFTANNMVTFSDADPNGAASDYAATIAWGDGQSSGGSIGTSGSNFTVSGSHTYTNGGSETETVSIKDPGGASASTTLTISVSGGITSTGKDLTWNVGQNNLNQVIATFTDSDANPTTTINWGDGTTSAGTITDTGGQSVSFTSTALVSSAWTVIQATSDSADPDRVYRFAPAGGATGAPSIDLNHGAVIISHPLDFAQSPGSDVGGNPALVDNSATVSPRPVIQLELQSDPNTSNPAATQYQVAWSFNGVSQTTATFPVSSFQAGAVYLMAVQVGSALTQTGVYPWSAASTITKQGGGTTTATPSGYVPVVVRDASVYGAGFGIDGIPQLYSIAANGTVPAGLLWVNGDGSFRFFTGTGPYTSPEDFGTLIKNADSTFKYTAKDQTVYNFSTANADGSFMLYQYESKFHEVTQTTNSLGAVTTAAYNQTTGLISSSADALGNTITYVWSNGRLQSQTDALGHIVQDRYDGDLRQIAQIDSLGNWTLTSYNSYGFVASSTSALGWVTQTTTNARGLATAATDANGNVVANAYYADGDLKTVTNARGYTRTITIDSRGLTTSTTDNLGNHGRRQ